MVRPRPLGALASLRLTLVGMAALGVAALASYRQAELSPTWLAAPLALLAVNLLAALICRPQFRRQGGLLVFHVCLLAIIALAALGLMTRLQGRVELVEGQVFDPAAVVTVRQGPWHPHRLDRVRFEQGMIEVDYGPNLARGRTRSELTVAAGEQGLYRMRVGDTRPLSLAGYRFITTFNKGYAALLTWRGPDGETVRGAVHMPAYPLWEWKQQNRWTAPRGETLELELELPEPARDRPWTLRSRNVGGRLIVRVAGANAVTLQPGASASLGGGSLRFEGLRLWMGYRIEYNPALPWLFAAAVVGVAGLAWHFWGKFGPSPVAALQPGRAGLGDRHGSRSGT